MSAVLYFPRLTPTKKKQWPPPFSFLLFSPCTQLQLLRDSGLILVMMSAIPALTVILTMDPGHVWGTKTITNCLCYAGGWELPPFYFNLWCHTQNIIHIVAWLILKKCFVKSWKCNQNVSIYSIYLIKQWILFLEASDPPLWIQVTTTTPRHTEEHKCYTFCCKKGWN